MRDREKTIAPRVSVVIPLYQNGRYIEKAVQSVLDQTFQDFEIIVVNDGSTDDGPGRVRRFADPRITVISQPNGGISKTRNTSFHAARGEYIALLDADDWWLPEKLQRHVEHLDQNPHVGLSLSASFLVDEHGAALGLVQMPAPGPYTARHQFCRNPVGNGSAAVIRRTALDRIKFYDEKRNSFCWFDEDFRRSEDVEFFLRLSVVGQCEFAAVFEPLTTYRIHPYGLSANIDGQLSSWLEFRRKVKTFAPDLEREVGDEAEAYERRYLARRAVRSKDKVAARTLMAEALWLSPSIVVREPAKTLVTMGAVAAMHVLPAKAHTWLEDTVLALVAAFKRRATPPVLGSSATGR